jgi:nicotinamidase-related amidase
MVLYCEDGDAMLRPRAAPQPNVLLDVDTQVDFLTPDGRRPVRNLQIVPNISRVFQWARRCRLTVISSIDFHRITDPPRDVPQHCLEGTAGIAKLACTLLPRRVLVQTDDTINLPHDLLTRFRQILFLKRGDDLTRNPKADRLLTEIQVGHFIALGSGLEESVRSLVLSLLTRRHSVWVVADACGYWDRQAADLTIKQLAAKGARILTTDELVQIQPDLSRLRRSILLRRRLRRDADRPAVGPPAN